MKMLMFHVALLVAAAALRLVEAGDGKYAASTPENRMVYTVGQQFFLNTDEGGSGVHQLFSPSGTGALPPWDGDVDLRGWDEDQEKVADFTGYLTYVIKVLTEDDLAQCVGPSNNKSEWQGSSATAKSFKGFCTEDGNVGVKLFTSEDCSGSWNQQEMTPQDAMKGGGQDLVSAPATIGGKDVTVRLYARNGPVRLCDVSLLNSYRSLVATPAMVKAAESTGIFELIKLSYQRPATAELSDEQLEKVAHALNKALTRKAKGKTGKRLELFIKLGAIDAGRRHLSESGTVDVTVIPQAGEDKLPSAGDTTAVLELKAFLRSILTDSDLNKDSWISGTGYSFDAEAQPVVDNKDGKEEPRYY